MKKFEESIELEKQPKEKTIFEKFDILNQGDTKNNTRHLLMSNAIVSVDKVKAGGHVTMGVEGGTAMDIINNQQDNIVILMVIDRKAFESIK